MTRPAADANVETIPAGVPFVDAVARSLLAGADGDAEALAATTILLPTRRGCRALGEAFRRQVGRRALLLPRIEPIGDVDEDAFGLELDEEAVDDLTLAPAISPLRRQLLLARLVRARDPDLSVDRAARLAADLGRLLDQVAIEGLDLAGLPGLVADDLVARPAAADLAEHWQKVVDFLAIVADHWPRILAEHGCLDAADRRNRLIRARADAWLRDPPADPVIAAGSTGSIPATAHLLAVIARLPRGRVILPGLDREMDAESWAAIGPSHPQAAMARLLARIGVDRSAVRPWPVPEACAAAAPRAMVLKRALDPLPDGIVANPPNTDDLTGLSRIDAPGPEDEARGIALILRDAVESPAETAALVTPDRNLARRVAGELRRWQIEIDDSAGVPLGRTGPGGLLRLLARAVAADLAPVPLLAVLKHPLVTGGAGRSTLIKAARHLERRVLRGLRPPPGIAGLRARLGQIAASEPVADLERLIADLEQWLAPLTSLVETSLAKMSLAETSMVETDLAGTGRHDLPAWIDGHLASLAALSDADRLWAGEAGEAAAAFLDELREAGEGFDPVDAGGYAALLDVMLANRPVRPRYGRHPRLFIWGPLEARLQQADVMVLGGLNEDVWPPAVDTGPWMSRGMMAAFGLPVPERRIGLSAHDFVQGAAARKVVLTRAARIEGTPTVPSRWLSRLETLIGDDAARTLHERGRPWLCWQAELDRAPRAAPAERPAPAPPCQARPRQLSVTDVETWMRDPYALYARRILRLKALDPLDLEPGPQEFGKLAHHVLERFVAERIDPCGVDAEARLLALAEPAFAALSAHPAVMAFWRPRLQRLARWIVDVEADRSVQIAAVAVEVAGALTLAAPAGPFVLTARADRIERRVDGGLVIIDHKTGAPPSAKDVEAGFAPQLPLEAAIAAAGGFAGVAGAPVVDLEFWRLHHRTPEIRPAAKDRPAEALAAAAMAGLLQLIERYDDPDASYPARPRSKYAPRYSDYDHLTRVREWAAGEDGGAE